MSWKGVVRFYWMTSHMECALTLLDLFICLVCSTSTFISLGMTLTLCRIEHQRSTHKDSKKEMKLEVMNEPEATGVKEQMNKLELGRPSES
ncbi:hypothetical protein BDZ97DRAFT_1825608 [Flammula alnicola]|nr:hypothetical protein BDZ97DRAFT_1825608 [Flammula alnicola]